MNFYAERSSDRDLLSGNTSSTRCFRFIGYNAGFIPFMDRRARPSSRDGVLLEDEVSYLAGYWISLNRVHSFSSSSLLSTRGL